MISFNEYVNRKVNFVKLINDAVAEAKRDYVFLAIKSDETLPQKTKDNMLLACVKSEDAVELCLAFARNLNEIEDRFLNEDLSQQFFIHTRDKVSHTPYTQE